MPEFRIAQVFDATAEDGTAVMGPGHPRIADPEERQRLLGYLRDAPVVLYTLERDDDRFQRWRGRAVPMSFHSDGTWVWSEELSYYLEHYAFAPEPALHRHIAANDYRVPEVAEDVLTAASRVFERPRR